MDNLTHTMAGYVLGQTGLKSQSRKGLAALMLGANLPDIDVFFGWVAWQPLAVHRGFTHGLLALILLPPLLFTLLWGLDRWQLWRGKGFDSVLAMRPARLLALCYLGALTHPSLDLLTTYSVQLLSPFSALWFHADGLFIIDLWLWLLLGGTLILSSRREKRGGDWRRPAQAAFAMTIAYIAANLLISERAHASVRQWAGDRPVDAIFASPPPLQSWKRGLVWREGDCYRHAAYDPFGGGIGGVGACQPTNMGNPYVKQAIRSDRNLRKFLLWSILPAATVEARRCHVAVHIGDARYGRIGRSRLAEQTRVPTGAPGCS